MTSRRLGAASSAIFVISARLSAYDRPHKHDGRDASGNNCWSTARDCESRRTALPCSSSPRESSLGWRSQRQQSFAPFRTGRLMRPCQACDGRKEGNRVRDTRDIVPSHIEQVTKGKSSWLCTLGARAAHAARDQSMVASLSRYRFPRLIVGDWRPLSRRPVHRPSRIAILIIRYPSRLLRSRRHAYETDRCPPKFMHGHLSNFDVITGNMLVARRQYARGESTANAHWEVGSNNGGTAAAVLYRLLTSATESGRAICDVATCSSSCKDIQRPRPRRHFLTLG